MESDPDAEDYGYMEAHYEAWSATDNPIIPMHNRPCTKKDFGLDPSFNETKRFFDLTETKKPEIERVLHRLHCIDEPIELYGDWNTGSAQVLFFVFKKCDPS